MESVTERVSETGLLEVDDVLEDVVAKGILHQVEGAVSDLADELGFLVTGGVIDATLQDTTAMTVRAHRHTVGANSIKDKLPLISQYRWVRGDNIPGHHRRRDG